jgi:hypothetical protein
MVWSTRVNAPFINKLTKRAFPILLGSHVFLLDRISIYFAVGAVIPEHLDLKAN